MAVRLIFTFEVDGFRWDEFAELVPHRNAVLIYSVATGEQEVQDLGHLLNLPSFRLLQLRSDW